MQKVFTQAKHIVIFILLLTVIPSGFVNGFFTYINHIEDEELAEMLKMTGNVYYDLCMDAAILSIICTYIVAHFIRQADNLKRWLKFLLIVILYVVLFFVWQFILIFLLGYI